MPEPMLTSPTLAAIAPALVKAQAAFKTAKKTATNPHLKSKFAALPDVMDAIKDALHANDLVLLQGVTNSDASGFALATRVLHSSGEWIESSQWFANGAKIQELGSVMTYARRYTISALLGVVADDDDDGNAASGTKEPAQARVVPTPKATNGGDSVRQVSVAKAAPAAASDDPFAKKIGGVGRFRDRAVNSLSLEEAQAFAKTVAENKPWKDLIDRYIIEKSVGGVAAAELDLEVV